MNALLAAYASSPSSSASDGGDGVQELAPSAKPEVAVFSHPDVKRRKVVKDIEPANNFPSRGQQRPRGVLDDDRSRVRSSNSFPTGRYVSKRERAADDAAALSAETSTLLDSSPVHPSPGVKDILKAEMPHRILKKLQNIEPNLVNYNRLPRSLVSQLEGHTKGVNAVRWSPTHASLLASAGMDHLACIWNVWNDSGQQRVRRLSSHTGAVKDIQWAMDGRFVLSCGFDKTCRLVDVELGSDVKVFSDDQIMNVVRFHPIEHGLFLSGGSNGALKLWDTRIGKPVKAYLKSLGQIMDVDFSIDGRRFVSTSDMAKRHASDKAIVVWDYNSQVALSNQVYVEAYTCPCVRYHPFEQTFIAQSNANYMAIFSANAPFKMDKYKRFEGHQVSAYPIQCNFSPCGGFVVTGSADGCVHIYSYRSSKLLKKLEAHDNACTDVSYHPVLPSVIASCSWDGMINIYE